MALAHFCDLCGEASRILRSQSRHRLPFVNAQPRFDKKMPDTEIMQAFMSDLVSVNPDALVVRRRVVLEIPCLAVLLKS